MKWVLDYNMPMYRRRQLSLLFFSLLFIWIIQPHPVSSKVNDYPFVGDKATDFTLKYLHSDKTFTLSDNYGKKPTVLIFGSYT